MAHIAIVGAGIGGLPMAYELRDKIGSAHRITVISNTPTFQFVPSNPWVAVGWRKRSDIEFGIGPYLAKRNIEFSPEGLKRLIPGENRLELGDGKMLDYDYLVLATGPELAFDEIEGLGPEANTQSICQAGHAAQAHVAWEEFVKNPGPIVIGAVQGASCFGPAYEFAMIVDTELRRRRLRHKVPMTFVTSEPFIGHLGLDGVGDTKSLLESAFRDRHIDWITNAKVAKVEAGAVHVVEVGEDGQDKPARQLPFKFSMLLPAFRGIAPLRGIDGLVNPRGFVIVDAYQRNPKYANVFGIGVCIAIAPPKATRVPTGVPKTGYMIESMVAATAANIAALIAGKQPEAKATWNAICLADFGDTGVAFVALPQIPPRNVNWSSSGKWVHLAKIAFEKYFLNKVKRGNTDPIYEKYILKLLRIPKLEEKESSAAS